MTRLWVTSPAKSEFHAIGLWQKQRHNVYASRLMLTLGAGAVYLMSFFVWLYLIWNERFGKSGR